MERVAQGSDSLSSATGGWAEDKEEKGTGLSCPLCMLTGKQSSVRHIQQHLCLLLSLLPSYWMKL